MKSLKNQVKKVQVGGGQISKPCKGRHGRGASRKKTRKF
nr:MAG TPA: hypothetical protein [Caudoviricetes sp.]DAZ48539.1 MAG TPA: hypothetical protein [Caudoviricetes sp.]